MGWVKFDRRILSHWIWTSEAFSRGQAWADLILLAGHKDDSVIVKGRVIHRKRGEVHRSVLWLAERWKWSKNKVLRFLKMLEDEGMIKKNGTPDGTTLTIENYTKFQDVRTADETPDETPLETPDETSDGTQSRIYKEYIKKRENKGAFRPPSIDEVRSFCTEEGLSVDPEVFVSFYAAKDWMVGQSRMVDWKSALKAWHLRSGASSPDMAEKGRREQEEREAALEAEWAKEFEARKPSGEHSIEHLREKYGIGRKR